MTNRVPALALFFLSGALALAYQVVWTRYLVLLLGASTPVVSIVIGVFMAGLALGARLIAEGHEPSGLGFGADSTLPVATIQA